MTVHHLPSAWTSFVSIVALCLQTACIDDLDRFPTNDVTSETVYATTEGYKGVLAKVYGAYALTGNQVSGFPDVLIGDGAAADFLRCFFNLQSMTTEEGICSWTDSGIPDLNFLTWNASNPFVSGMYYRSLFQISMANEFMRESTDEKLQKRGFTDSEADEIRTFRTEARFIRAFQYWVLLDLFGNPPFIDEHTPIGKHLPPRMQRAELFRYIETELLDIEARGGLKSPRTNEYGRADRAACWALLARLYLNAAVYTGTGRYEEAIAYAKKVIDAGYALKERYEELFLADNHLNNPEVILSINYDGLRTRGYGGMTYLINAAFIRIRDDSPGIDFQDVYGMKGQGGWFGVRSRKELPGKFVDANDRRYLFVGSQADVDNVNEFTEGLGVMKFRNVRSTGELGSNAAEMFADTDFPLFRLAEMYLIYAESVLRGNRSDLETQASFYLNELRRRAFGDDAHSLPLSLDNLIDERARELYWEGFRRTDLIRFGLYTSGAYLWQWKGGVKDGIALSDDLNLFPLPASDVIANPNLKQNEGY